MPPILFQAPEEPQGIIDQTSFSPKLHCGMDPRTSLVCSGIIKNHCLNSSPGVSLGGLVVTWVALNWNLNTALILFFSLLHLAALNIFDPRLQFLIIFVSNLSSLIPWALYGSKLKREKYETERASSEMRATNVCGNGRRGGREQDSRSENSLPLFPQLPPSLLSLWSSQSFFFGLEMSKIKKLLCNNLCVNKNKMG